MDTATISRIAPFIDEPKRMTLSLQSRPVTLMRLISRNLWTIVIVCKGI